MSQQLSVSGILNGQAVVRSRTNGTAEEESKVKTLPPSVVKDIEQKNLARRLAGLSPIVIKVRRCVSCGCLFESAGNRTCGCSNRTVGVIAGREII